MEEKTCFSKFSKEDLINHILEGKFDQDTIYKIVLENKKDDEICAAALKVGRWEYVLRELAKSSNGQISTEANWKLQKAYHPA